MIFSLNGLLRGFIYLTIVSSITAIGISRLAPQESHFRILKPSMIVPVNGYHFRSYDRIPRVLDPMTGLLSDVTLEGVDSFDSATCSPWENDRGQSYVVGRWLGRSKADDGICQGCGLGRFKFPGGKTLERVKLDVMPVSRPCFFPDDPSRVIFAAGDGQLYRYQFEKESDTSESPGEGTRLSPLVWKVATAGEMPVSINDPIWPTDPRLKSRLIASLTFIVKDTNGKSRMRTRLGWLQLNPAGTEIVRAGRLIGQPDTMTPGAGTTPRPDESLPAVYSAGSGGGLTLAYMTHEEHENGWGLHVAPLEIEFETGIPIVDELRCQTVADKQSHAIPIFSADGRTLFSVLNTDPKPETLVRIPVPNLERAPAAVLARLVLRKGRVAWN
ncbi:hypothetical protein SAMN05444166_6585 [Singulisphaera sp. GP187]|uniref:hypothetical protein n=1 Tax=Singulisphaera sp. GP187 TaxID=1882752 RepID=UPI00092C742A|nr:hypothetical protein [Singulisphaera sp. GP187]SIO60951.1 hypothetical protein SAMN05444166_6585 [Singulisphaera sp. GP187]